MFWKFIKSNWFFLALALLVCLAVARRKLYIGVTESVSPAKVERYTEELAEARQPSNLGLLPETGEVAEAPKTKPVDDAAAVAFLRRFSHVVQGEHKKFGFPASVLLALAYVNSRAGQSEAAAQAQNFFGLPCSPDWEGATAQVQGRCVRQYKTAWESFRDFSIYLTTRDWIGDVKKTAGKDWRAWAKGLSQRDLPAASQTFEKELVQVIEAYRLYELD